VWCMGHCSSLNTTSETSGLVKTGDRSSSLNMNIHTLPLQYMIDMRDETSMWSSLDKKA